MNKESWEESYKKGETPWRDYDVDLSESLKKAGIYSGVALDLGCGTGELSKWLSNHDFIVEGIDFSEEALRVARDICPSCNFTNWDLDDLENYPFKHDKYDIILDSKTIAFIKNKEKYLDTIRKKLKGIFMLQVFLRADEKPFIAVDERKLELLLKERFNILSKQVNSFPNKIWTKYLLQSG
ncbi:MAG: class I SAM-dependent methyltransferase [Patescibacteria group bacterium]